jgi:3-oxoacyl-[acyl-carrier protein] reductase
MLDENVLIIGANGSIGCAIVDSLYKAYHVIATYHNNCDTLEKYKSQIDVVNFNVINLNLIDGFVDKLVEEFGSIKSVIYVSGYQNIKSIKFISIEDCKRQFDINYFSPLIFAKSFAKKNVHSNQNPSLIFISSLASKKPEPGILNYSASKAALDNLCIGLSKEIKPIRVNAVSPSFLETNMTAKFPKIYTDEFVKKLESKYPLGLGSVNDVANMVKYLISDEASYITGAVINVDGGASTL